LSHTVVIAERWAKIAPLPEERAVADGPAEVAQPVAA
jgi:hypothetical protein